MQIGLNKKMSNMPYLMIKNREFLKENIFYQNIRYVFFNSIISYPVILSLSLSLILI